MKRLRQRFRTPGAARGKTRAKSRVARTQGTDHTGRAARKACRSQTLPPAHCPRRPTAQHTAPEDATAQHTAPEEGTAQEKASPAFLWGDRLPLSAAFGAEPAASHAALLLVGLGIPAGGRRPGDARAPVPNAIADLVPDVCLR